MQFTGFQNLYQHLKQKDIRLFEAIEKISQYLSGIITAQSTPAPLAWTVLPTLKNGWVASTVNLFGIPMFALSGNDIFLRGLISSGTNTDNTTLWQFPTGYRPPYILDIPVIGFTAGFIVVPGAIRAYPDGTVRCYGLSTATYISLGCMRYNIT